MSKLIYWSIPAFIITVILEALYMQRLRRDAIARARLRGYEVKDTFTSLGMGIGNVIIASFVKLGAVAIWFKLYEHRLFEIPATWWSFGLLFFAEDFCYYWFHRASHEVRFFWAAHINHHSSTHYNLSTALRQSWTTPLTGIPFWLVLPLLGFAPWMVLTQQAISLLYQYWLHTEAIDRMGPFEWFFNTPSHHRVHHGRDTQYLDRNHGGILIIWDRLFGSFEPEAARVDYGLTKNLESHNLFVVAFHEWIAIARDVIAARSLRDAWMFVFGPPGWSPDGSRLTAKQMRAASSGRVDVIDDLAAERAQ
jgi:sterol desaturase/sphingolipid hydroxylase (fatty acid hydroxylase superfamily)